MTTPNIPYLAEERNSANPVIRASDLLAALNDDIVIDGGSTLTTSTGIDDMVTMTDSNGTMLAYGSPSVAADFLTSGKKALVIGDSTMAKTVIYLQQPFYRNQRYRKVRQHTSAAGLGGTYYVSGTNSLVATPLAYSPYRGAYEYAMSATLVPADANFYSNRVAQYDFQGQSRTETPLVSPTNADVASGNLVTLTKTLGARVQLEIRAYPGGEPQNVFRLYLSDGATVLGTSAAFNNYAATETIRTITVDLASWTGAALSATAKLVPGTTPTASRYFIVYGATLESLPTVASNMIVDSISYGGELVTTYLSSSHMDSTAWSLLATLDYDLVIIALGINGSLASVSDYQALIDLIRQENTTLPIIFTTESTQSPGSTTVVTRTAFLQGMVDDNADTLLLCTDKMLPAYASQFVGYDGTFQSGSWYRRGDVVLSSGVYYCCLGGGVGSSTLAIYATTTPASDATQWAPIGNNGDNDTYTTAFSRNRMLGDAVHPHAFGHHVYGLAWWSLLEMVARSA